MADQPAQPESGPEQGLEELESQLDALLDAIEQTPAPAKAAPRPAGVPSSVQPPPAQPAQAAADPSDTDHHDDEAAAGDDDDVDLVGVDLARQIQELLDDAKSEMKASGHPAADDPGPKLMATKPLTSATADAELIASPPQRVAEPAPAAAPESSESVPAASDDAPVEGLGMTPPASAAALADEPPADEDDSDAANEVLEGTFEAPEAVAPEVALTAAKAPAPVPPVPPAAPARAGAKPAAADDDPIDAEELDRLLKSVEASAARDSGKAAPAAEEELDAAFEAPHDVVAQAEAQAQPPDPAPAATVQPAPVAAAAKASAPEPVATPVAPEPTTLKQIDALIAQGADDAVSGDFETIDDVLATEGGTGSPRTAAGSAAKTHKPSQFAADDPPADEQSQEEEIEGDFSTPEQLIGGASAKDVAAELDADAAPPRPARRAAKPASEPVASDSADVDADLDQPRTPVVVVLSERLRYLCATLNQPLYRFSPETRNLVGYIGIITVFNGSVVLIGKLLGMLMH